MTDIPTVAWDETSPADTQLRSLGDDRIREMKVQIREILSIDHIIDYPTHNQGDTWGYHNKATIISSETSYGDGIHSGIEVYSAGANYWLLYGQAESGTETITYLMQGDEFCGGIRYEIRAWYGAIANIPTGWRICDGNYGTKNYLDRFICGIATSATNPDNPGGRDTVTMTTSIMPAHSHATAGTTFTHSHNLGFSYFTDDGIVSPAQETTGNSTFTLPSSGTHSHSVGTTGNVSPSSWSNRPVYYEVAFIQKT
jgi:hypothetical protein